ncbi:MAG TPA: thioredoxin domain-containing protein, partial [Terriglobales bacterium]|nr:thioredoxin domain-containing protein [Terriglobales bacterium]
AVLLVLAIVGTIASRAQDVKALRPPKGAKVAIVVFEDMQCPDCARANPLLQEAARTYKIPLVRYDFPLPMHDWSKEAAIIAHYFDAKSKKLGNDYRDDVFKHQQEINKQNLRAFSEKFAAEHKIDLPMFVDPQGKFAAEVQADSNFGQRVGINHTPTIYVVSNARQGTPFVEVVDRSQLFQMIDQMKREAE